MRRLQFSSNGPTMTCWMLTGEAESRKRNASEFLKLNNWKMVILFREEAWKGRFWWKTERQWGASWTVGFEVAKGACMNRLQMIVLESGKHTA